VVLRGLNLSNATVSAYDPMGDTNMPVTVAPLDRSRASLQLSATDYPRLLIIEESAAPAPDFNDAAWRSGPFGGGGGAKYSRSFSTADPPAPARTHRRWA
jgi:hypothetical protein